MWRPAGQEKQQPRTLKVNNIMDYDGRQLRQQFDGHKQEAVRASFSTCISRASFAVATCAAEPAHAEQMPLLKVHNCPTNTCLQPLPLLPLITETPGGSLFKCPANTVKLYDVHVACSAASFCKSHVAQQTIFASTAAYLHL
jgi:hypothetical protein